MNKRLFYILFTGVCLCLCLSQMAAAVTYTVAARDASSSVKASAKYVCDGSNDQVEIMKAINALPSSGGSVVLSAGTFVCSDRITPRQSNTLKGQGADATILKFLSGDVMVRNSYVTLSDFQVTGKGGVKIYSTTSLIAHITLNNIKAYNLDKSVQAAFKVTPNHGVEDLVFNDCKAIDCDGNGFVGWVDGGYESSGYMRNIRLNRCSAIRCAYYDQYRNPPTAGAWIDAFCFNENCRSYDVTYTDCVADSSWESGFHNEPAHARAITTNTTYLRCISRNNGQSYWQGELAEPVFGDGFMPVTGTKLIDCVSEGNYIGFCCNDGGGTMIGCTDTKSKYGYVIIKSTNGYYFTNCKATGLHPVEFWGGGGKAVIDGMTITNPSPTSGIGIWIRGGITNPGLITIKNSKITGFKEGIHNSAYTKGMPTVSNVVVTGATTNFYKCKVVAASGSSIPATSTSTTAYAGSSDAVNTDSSAAIAVTSPNGGENWARGTLQKITWKYTGSPGSTVRIALYKGGVWQTYIISGISIGSGGVGSFTWKIPSTQMTGSDYSIRVSSMSASTIKDYSNSNFRIS